jgi:hypothetical protein
MGSGGFALLSALGLSDRTLTADKEETLVVGAVIAKGGRRGSPLNRTKVSMITGAVQ